jgi:hypothetical protein
MLKGHNFIYFGPEKWDGLWRNRHQLMSRFSKLNKVVYVEPRFWLKSIRMKLSKGEITWRDFYNDIKQKRLSKIKNSLYIYHSPIFIPISGRFPLNLITMFLWKIFFKIALFKLNLKDPIIWLSRPEMLDFIGKFNERLLIYHVVDEYLAYDGVNKTQRNELREKEKIILRKADLVIVVSQNLLRSKSSFNKSTHLVPNAVDFQEYSKSLSSIINLPADIAELKKPLIGYSGRIGSKLDFNLLYDMANMHPEWSLVFVGVVDRQFCEDPIEQMKSLKNVHFLGFKNVSVLAEYINAFDICILPYLINEHSKNISPLKLYDYLAFGKAIVATNIFEAHNFKEVIKIAYSKEEFIRCVLDALNESNEDLVQKRISLASQNTWEDRIKQINELINFKLNDPKIKVQYNS